MKRVFLLFSVCVALLTAVAARATFAATDVTGSWTAEMSSLDGNTMQLNFVFKQDGAVLSGTVQGPQGGCNRNFKRQSGWRQVEL